MTFEELHENWIKPTGKDDLESKLEKKGWKYLGSGAFGTVFQHPRKNYVLKVYQDKGYRTFLNFLESEQGNPNVVMIKRNIFKDSETSLNSNSPYGELVALEKLKPLPYGSPWWKFIQNIWFACPKLTEHDKPQIISQIRDNLQRVIDIWRNKYKEEPNAFVKEELKTIEKTAKSFEVFLTRYKNLADTIFKLKKYVDENKLNIRFDLHSGNFMIRPSTGQVVITDPLK